MRPKLAVLVSGTGSLLEAIIRQDLNISFVLADRECRGIDIAKQAGIPCTVLRRTFWKRKDAGFDAAFSNARLAYTLETLHFLRRQQIALVAMAGYMTILDQTMFVALDGYAGRILNTHPSLLPAFKGKHPVRDALAYGVKITGCTVHIATPELDSGRILGQAAVPVLDGDTEAVLHERIKVEERKLYPQIIREQFAAL